MTDNNELLRQCIASGQVSAQQAVAHHAAGEIGGAQALRKFQAIDFINTEEELEAYVSGRMLGLQQGYDAARLEIEALRMRSAEPAGELPPLPASYVGGTLLSAEPGITGCKVVLRFSNTDEAEVWFGALATRSAAPVAQWDAEDAARMDWLEQQVRQSRTGVSFDYGRSVDGGLVTEKGYRFMKHHLLCDRMPTLRAAIDAASARAKEGGAA